MSWSRATRSRSTSTDGAVRSPHVRDGDWLKVAGPPEALGRWDVSRLANLTTGSTVIMMGGHSRAATVATLIALGVAVLLLLLIGVSVVVALASS